MNEKELDMNDLINNFNEYFTDFNKTTCEYYRDYLKNYQKEKLELQQERDKYKSIVEELKEQIKIGMGKFSNKNYGLVFDIEEVPKEEMNDFITCLAMQTMEAILIQIECNKIKELEEGNNNEDR